MGKKAKSKAIAVPRAQEEQNAAVNAASGQYSTNDTEKSGSEGNASNVARVSVIVPVFVEAGESSNAGNAKQADDPNETGESGNAGKAKQTDDPTETGESGNAGKAKQTDDPTKTGESSNAGNAKQADDPTETGESGNAGNAKQTGDPAGAESKETKDKGGAGKAPPEFRYIPHKEFKSLVDGNVSKFPYADKSVEVGSTYYYRKHMDTYIHWAIGVSYGVIGHVRLILTFQIFKEAVAQYRYNFLPKKYLSVYIDKKVWDYFFGKHLEEKLVEKPAFPFEIPEKDFTLEHCKAFSIWRMAIGLSVNQVEPSSDQILQATGEVLKEGPLRTLMSKYTRPDFQAMLDEAGHTSFYESVPLPDSESESSAIKKGSSVTKSSSDPKDSSSIEGKGKLVPGMSANLGTESNSTTRGLSSSCWANRVEEEKGSRGEKLAAQTKTDPEAEKQKQELRHRVTKNLAAVADLWKRSTVSDAEEIGFVESPFGVWIPGKCSGQGLAPASGVHSIVLTQGDVCVFSESPPGGSKLTLMLGIRPEVEYNSDSHEKAICTTYRMLFQWAKAFWLGVPVPLPSWNKIWTADLYGPIKGDFSPTMVRVSAMHAGNLAKVNFPQYVDLIYKYRENGMRQLKKWRTKLVSTPKNGYAGFIEEMNGYPEFIEQMKKDVRGEIQVPIWPRSFDRFMHYSLLAIMFVVDHGEQFWGLERHQLARKLSLDLMEMAMESQTH